MKRSSWPEKAFRSRVSLLGDSKEVFKLIK